MTELRTIVTATAQSFFAHTHIWQLDLVSTFQKSEKTKKAPPNCFAAVDLWAKPAV